MAGCRTRQGIRLAAVCAAAVLLPGMVAAADAPDVSVQWLGLDILGRDTDYVGVGGGAFNVIPNDRETKVLNDATVAAGRLEYRSGRKLYSIGPVAGVLANVDGGVLGYGGIYMDVRTGNWVLTPMFAAAGYRRGNSKDLGGVFLFHMGLEVSYEVERRYRLGLRMTHTSNAWIHDINPGVESAMVTVSIPLGRR